MNSQDIQDSVVRYAQNRADFNAPYGVLTSTGTDTKGKTYLSVTFGRARTLDVEVRIYNRGFMLLRSSREGMQVYRSYQSLIDRIKTL